MDITSLKNKIQESGISPELKKEINEMIDTEGAYSEALIQKIQNLLDGTAENLIEQIANLEIEGAVDEFNTEMDEIEKETDELNDEITRKVHEIDLADIQEGLGVK